MRYLKGVGAWRNPVYLSSTLSGFIRGWGRFNGAWLHVTLSTVRVFDYPFQVYLIFPWGCWLRGKLKCGRVIFAAIHPLPLSGCKLLISTVWNILTSLHSSSFPYSKSNPTFQPYYISDALNHLFLSLDHPCRTNILLPFRLQLGVILPLFVPVDVWRSSLRRTPSAYILLTEQHIYY